jgi:hypothetical protein
MIFLQILKVAKLSADGVDRVDADQELHPAQSARQNSGIAGLHFDPERTRDPSLDLPYADWIVH